MRNLRLRKISKCEQVISEIGTELTGTYSRTHLPGFLGGYFWLRNFIKVPRRIMIFLSCSYPQDTALRDDGLSNSNPTSPFRKSYIQTLEDRHQS